MSKSGDQIIDTIFALFSEQAHLIYGESVTTVEHMLQCAHFAAEETAHGTLVASALLHDIGHLVHGMDEDIAEQGIDGHHEDAGADYLAPWFVAAVTEPARLHVAAKRYLCTVDSTYEADLSPSSVLSLKLQGGPMSAAEVTSFEGLEHCEDAVRLRRYDDRGKIPGMKTQSLESFRPAVEASLRAEFR